MRAHLHRCAPSVCRLYLSRFLFSSDLSGQKR
nr:MAG TPA: hypothetical protein [Caudoviricetes sp.]